MLKTFSSNIHLCKNKTKKQIAMIKIPYICPTDQPAVQTAHFLNNIYEKKTSSRKKTYTTHLPNEK